MLLVKIRKLGKARWCFDSCLFVVKTGGTLTISYGEPFVLVTVMMAVLLVLIIAAIRIYALVFTSVLPYCRRLPFFTQSQCLAGSQPPFLYMKASGGVLLRFFFFFFSFLGSIAMLSLG